MKQFIRKITLFIGLTICFWVAGIMLNTIIFCIFFNMNKNSPDFTMNHFLMVEINKMLIIPAFFITKYLINKNEQIVF